MTKKSLLSLFAALTLLGSCSNDIENPAIASGKDGKITFKTWSGKQLRGEATIVNTMDDFVVGAWDVLGRDSLMDNRVVYKVGGKNGSWDYNGEVFWPNFGTVVFYAISPSTDSGVPDGALSLTDTTLQISYTTPVNVDDMKDLLVTKQRGTFANNGASGVTLNFHHALARLKIDIYCKGDDPATINRLTLMNIKTKGDLQLKDLPTTLTAFPYPDQTTPTDQLGTKWQTRWTTSGGGIDSIAYTPVNFTVTASQTETLIGDTETPDIYVIPQTTEPVPTSTTEVVGGVLPGGYGHKPDSGFYILLNYTQAGQDSEYYIPVPPLLGPTTGKSITFEMERQYHFVINIVSGATIQFTTSMGEYDDVDPIVKQVPAAPAL